MFPDNSFALTILRINCSKGQLNFFREIVKQYFVNMPEVLTLMKTGRSMLDPDQPPHLRRRVWSGSALFDTRYINGTYISCCESNLNTYRCFQYRIRADLGLYYVKCPKVPFRVTLAIYILVIELNEVGDIVIAPYNTFIKARTIQITSKAVLHVRLVSFVISVN